LRISSARPGTDAFRDALHSRQQPARDRAEAQRLGGEQDAPRGQAGRRAGRIRLHPGAAREGHSFLQRRGPSERISVALPRRIPRHRSQRRAGLPADERNPADARHGVQRRSGAREGDRGSAALPGHAKGHGAADHAAPGRGEAGVGLHRVGMAALRLEQLDGHLSRELQPLYAIHGDEPLLALEAADAIRARARASGFSARVVLAPERGFDWGELAASGASRSLFGDKKLIELRLAPRKPGADGVEGKLLAAHQEIQKLALLLPAGELDFDAVREAVMNVARYDALKLAEAMLSGERSRLARILEGLRGEGEAPPRVLWILAEEIRAICRVQNGIAAGRPLAEVLREARVWGDARQSLVGRAAKELPRATLLAALEDAAKVDRVIKGIV